MPTNIKRRFWLILAIIALLVFGGVAASTRGKWLPLLASVGQSDNPLEEQTSNVPHDEHEHAEEHDHDHEGHVESNSLELSDQARRSLGLIDDKLQPIELQNFTRTLNVPAQVIERVGRTRIRVAAPMAGIVSKVNVVRGEAISPGTTLFRIQLTHEDLVRSQSVFVSTLGELDVENREIARLQKLDDDGVIAGKRLLEREYAKQKLEATLSAQRESLRLHGLTAEQVADIERDRRMLRSIEVRAPLVVDQGGVEARRPDMQDRYASREYTPSSLGINEAVSLVVQGVNIEAGAFVKPGDTLCELVDLTNLYLEGRAFEQDANELLNAAQHEWKISAVPESGDKKLSPIDNLEIVYVDNQVQADSRALNFYVALPNEVVHENETPDGHRFLSWRFKPGQRMQLLVPVEQWNERIVLPVDAVATEGVENYIFLQNGDHFDRIPVQVEYQDQFSTVIANDGSVFPGDIVARSGAHQLQMALKNKSGGGADPHAGHMH